MNRITITMKVIFAFLIVAVPITFLLFVSTDYSKYKIREQVSLSNLNLLNNYMLQIDTSLKSVNRYMYKTVSTVKPYLLSKEYRYIDPPKYIYSLYEVNKQLVRDIYSYPFLSSMFIYVSDEDRMVVTPTTEEKSINIVEGGFLKELSLKAETSSWSIFYGDTPALVLLKSLDQTLYIGACLDIKNIMPTDMVFDEDTEIAITDTESHVLVGDKKIENVSVLEKHDKWDGVHSVAINTDNKNEKFILIEAASDISPIILKLAVPERKMYKALVSIQKFNYFALILIIIVLFAYVVLLRRAVITPINQVLKAMKSFAEGNWDTKLPRNMGKEFNHIAEGFNNMVDQIHSLKISMYDEKLKAQRAEYKQLQMQINPHFYMNSLNIIYNMATLKDYENIKNMSLYLSNHFNYITKGSANSLANLDDEIRFAINYLEINRLRFGKELQFKNSLEPEIKTCKIPMLTIQTFIENSIKHGFVNRNKPFKIFIDARPWPENKESFYEIIIRDTGIGFNDDFLRLFYSNDFLQQSDGHIGIRNIVARLKFRYNDLAKVDLANADDGGAIVRILLPRSEPDI